MRALGRGERAAAPTSRRDCRGRATATPRMASGNPQPRPQGSARPDGAHLPNIPIVRGLPGLSIRGAGAGLQGAGEAGDWAACRGWGRLALRSVQRGLEAAGRQMRGVLDRGRPTTGMCAAVCLSFPGGVCGGRARRMRGSGRCAEQSCARQATGGSRPAWGRTAGSFRRASPEGIP